MSKPLAVGQHWRNRRSGLTWTIDHLNGDPDSGALLATLSRAESPRTLSQAPVVSASWLRIAYELVEVTR